MQGVTAANNDFDLNPIIRTAISTTRTWTDTNRDFVPNCDLANTGQNGECAAMNNANLGKEVFDRTYDPNFVEGFGVRPYSWSLGVSVQQEVMPRVSVNVGYFRNWWGNWYTVDNRTNALADWTPFGIQAPVDGRLPGGGGQVISGLYDLVPAAVGKVDELGDQFEEHRRADRELAGRRFRRQRAAAEWADGAGWHEHRTPPLGRLCAESRLAGAGPRHTRGDHVDQPAVRR